MNGTVTIPAWVAVVLVPMTLRRPAAKGDGRRFAVPGEAPLLRDDASSVRHLLARQPS